MLKLNVKNETSSLKAVVLGTALSNGPTPKIEEAYDPKSIEHIKLGTYPIESDMIRELDAVTKVLEKHNVKVYRPEIITNCNQIFTRDIAFVIDDVMILANVLPEREKELKAIQYVVDMIVQSKVIQPPPEVHIEGGDVILWNNYIFIGTYKGNDYKDYKTARTNNYGVDFIKNLFPNKIVKAFDLIKSNTEPRDNALHLDCCFQPVGKDKGIIYKQGFRDEKDYTFLVNLFGKENLFEINREEMYNMNSNIFSIDEDIVISEQHFTRLNAWLEKHHFKVEKVPYSEIAKQEGLLRCSTMPLIRG